jgi:hypothetical protein
MSCAIIGGNDSKCVFSIVNKIVGIVVEIKKAVFCRELIKKYKKHSFTSTFSQLWTTWKGQIHLHIHNVNTRHEHDVHNV